MASCVYTVVCVLSVWQEMSSEKLVPGDVIAVMTASLMECDAVLLDGLVICNESMLTGETLNLVEFEEMLVL